MQPAHSYHTWTMLETLTTSQPILSCNTLLDLKVSVQRNIQTAGYLYTQEPPGAECSFLVPPFLICTLAIATQIHCSKSRIGTVKMLRSSDWET